MCSEPRRQNTALTLDRSIHTAQSNQTAIFHILLLLIHIAGLAAIASVAKRCSLRGRTCAMHLQRLRIHARSTMLKLNEMRFRHAKNGAGVNYSLYDVLARLEAAASASACCSKMSPEVQRSYAALLLDARCSKLNAICVCLAGDEPYDLCKLCN